jgi:hypothetical protein
MSTAVTILNSWRGLWVSRPDAWMEGSEVPLYATICPTFTPLLLTQITNIPSLLFLFLLDNQVVNQNDVFKEQMVQQLIQAESQFLGDLDAFHTHFAATMPHFQVQKNKLAFQPEDCDILFRPTQSLISAHKSLLDELRQRYSIDHLTLIADPLFFPLR